jgi:L-fuconolactonase
MTDAGSATAFGRVNAPNADWLARAVPEEALEPDLPIVDTHHHFWVRPGDRYLLDELLADMDCGHTIAATVFEECHAFYRADGPKHMRPLGEVEFVTGVAAMSRSGRYGPTKVAAGIVGKADLSLGAVVEEVLTAQIAASGGRFRGVRHSAAWDADPIIGNGARAPGLYLDAKFGVGLDSLTALGLSLDAWAFHTQLDDITTLATQHPDAQIVLCHCGGPLGYGPYAGKQAEVRSRWLQSITELAKRPNVVVKLGGMMMRLAAYDYGVEPAPPTSVQLADLWKPYIEPCIELFGPERCMVESNFPVEKMGIAYGPLWNAFKQITKGASAAEKTMIYSDTANRIYKLGLDG